MAWNEPGGNGSKDPRGHRNEQGPPDLDEIIKKMRDKLSGLLTKGGGGPSHPGTQWNSTAISMIIAALWVVWMVLGEGFYIVQPAEQAIVTRFGAYLKTTEQGPYLHLPYPIERVDKINVEQIRVIQHKALMLTQDENLVEIELVVQYRVKNAKDYVFNVVEPDDTLHQATESALREIVGDNQMDKVLTVDRTEVANATKRLTQAIIDRYHTGLEVISVNMQNAQPPQEVQEAFADVIKAREDKERLKNQAESYANEVTQKAQGSADKIREEALAYKAQVVANAQGETQRFLNILREYEKAPLITSQRLYLETMEMVLTNTSKVLIDAQGSHPLMVLEIDELLNKTTPLEPAPVATTPLLSPAKVPGEEDMKGEDDIRSRGGR